MMIREVNLEFANKNYEQTIALAVKYCSLFSFVVSPKIIYSAATNDLIAELSNFLVNENSTSEWPGTKLITGTVNQYIYELNDKSALILTKYAKNFFDWEKPKLPEDLTFLRSDLTPWLISISHEEDIYMEVSKAEFREIKTAMPELFCSC